MGLGNPGLKYEQTRHNAGFWFVESIAQSQGGRFKRAAKFHGEICKLAVEGQGLWLLKPDTFMNLSGLAVGGMAKFYQIVAEDILIAHDELDLPPGIVRLKQGGGHAGHQGLSNTIAHLGKGAFLRLRFGVGRPEHGGDLTGYVLGRPTQQDREFIDQAITATLGALDHIIKGELQRAMNHLHSLKLAVGGEVK